MTPWNPAHFGAVPHKAEPTGQLTIFWEDSLEPPDPDDYRSPVDYETAWAQWLKQNPWYGENYV